MNSVAIVLNFHNEGSLSIPSIRNLYDAYSIAKKKHDNLQIEFLACCDNADPSTKQVIEDFREFFDHIFTLQLSDLGASRNWITQNTDYDYFTFHDSDDLVCLDYFEQVISHSLKELSSEIIWHPEYVYFFDENDFNSINIKSEFLHMTSSDSKFDDLLIFTNLYTSNAFTSKRIYKDYPYIAVDKSNQIGVEDWDWNRRTTFAGIPHKIVQGTVHCVRLKNDSLSKSNVKLKILPPRVVKESNN